MFKKRVIEKKVNLDENIEQIEVKQDKNEEDDKIQVPKSNHSKKINKFSSRHDKEQTQSKPPQSRAQYGLIDHPQILVAAKPKDNNPLMDMYVKKRMDQMQSNQKQQTLNSTANEIMKMQKQYLEPIESKLALYDPKELRKKFQSKSAGAIKTELQARNNYLKNLLENQHQRMEYASKKQLKMLKQQRQRQEKQLFSKYKDSGRRHFVDKMKNSSLLS